MRRCRLQDLHRRYKGCRLSRLQQMSCLRRQLLPSGRRPLRMREGLPPSGMLHKILAGLRLRGRTLGGLTLDLHQLSPCSRSTRTLPLSANEHMLQALVILGIWASMTNAPGGMLRRRLTPPVLRKRMVSTLSSPRPDRAQSRPIGSQPKMNMFPLLHQRAQSSLPRSMQQSNMPARTAAIHHTLRSSKDIRRPSRVHTRALGRRHRKNINLRGHSRVLLYRLGT